uniref:SHC-transforming protein 1 n=1 Tax=Nomascus leucogenys TaxID=61853 RepID=A0A2I3HSJ2_NOMLE
MNLLPHKPKYNALRNESLSSLKEGPSGSTLPEELPSPSASSLGPILPLLPRNPSPTTLNLRLANRARGHLGPKGDPGRAANDGEGIVGDMNKLSGGGGCRTQVEGGQLGGEEWTRHGSFVNKPMWGWLHPSDKVMRPGVSYLVWYMGCVEVLQSMSALDFNTWTQVTREAISLVCQGAGGTGRRKPCSHPLSSILGRSNLKFAGMIITTANIITNHHMQSISFASSGDPDTAEYVTNIAKDPVNQKACHILECPQGLAQDVISTTGQKPPKLVTPYDRMTGFDGLAWDEEEGEPPGHQLREGAAPGAARPTPPSAQTPSHLGATLPLGQSVGGDPEVCKQMPPPPPCLARELFDDPSNVNMQNLDKSWQAGGGAGTPNPAINGSTPWDLFDMKPFEDALHMPPPPQLVSMREAEALLQLNGDFLVQESMTTPGQYVLTGLQSGDPKHLLLVDPEGVVRTKDHRFESVSHLISYHMDNHLPIISAGSELCLQQPVEQKL